jgi:hypothetical protein
MSQTPEEATKALAEATGTVTVGGISDAELAKYVTTDINNPGAILTTSDSQATSPNDPAQTYTSGQVNQNLAAQDDAVVTNTDAGVGAGTSGNPDNSRGNDDSAPQSSTVNQQAINQNFANRQIVPQPNVLDQYASYTYAISWWLLTPDQYNNLSTGLAPAFGTGDWSLLMQSGGAPAAGRNPAFPLDYYLDDLEIETFLMGKGTNMSTNGMDIKFKVVEPNGITLIQNLYKAVVSAYRNIKAPNYAAAQYCLTIEFYGYDSNGNLIAPATGGVTGSGIQSVIKKYYPFLIETLTFRTVANQVEYLITGKPVPYATGGAQARGTIPFAFELAGQTALQLLNGGPLPVSTATDPGARATSPRPNLPAPPPQLVRDLPANQQAAVAAGTDANTVSDDGGLTGA